MTRPEQSGASSRVSGQTERRPARAERQEVRNMRQNTPWGQADGAEVLADGVIQYTTPEHGGIWLSSKRREAIAPIGAKNWLGSMEWWEEDVDWSVPFWFFRNDIRAFGNVEKDRMDMSERAAQATIRQYHKECANRLLSSPAQLSLELR